MMVTTATRMDCVVRDIILGLHRLQCSSMNHDMNFIILSFDMFCHCDDKKKLAKAMPCRDETTIRQNKRPSPLERA